jgi:hypothetical protein
MNRKELQDARWPVERAKSYMERHGVIKGVNYVPAYCHSYIEMWQNYREPAIRQELMWARDIGINSLRIFICTAQYQTRKDECYKNIDRFLGLCEEMGMTVMFTFQPNRMMTPGTAAGENPFITKLRPGVHDGGWDYENSTHDPAHWGANWQDIHDCVYETLTRYKDDKRIMVWDLYNEAWNKAGKLVEHVFSAAREADPSQPLTACWMSLDISDVTTFHCYERPGQSGKPTDWDENVITFEEEIKRVLSTGRPILCTECLARSFGNELAAFLPFFAEHNIGWYIWGLCAGTAQYHYPWNWPEGSPEPKRWFHCILYPDGSAYDPSELLLIKEFKYVGKK